MKGKKLDQILVVDVESTCWEGAPPSGEENEIIEIGACLLDVSNCGRHDKTGIRVRSRLSSVSEYCTRLTTLTQEQVEPRRSFRGCVFDPNR